ncbi:hypothetical protein ADL21_06305 [Streptomyces albus subsp. albus]|nr:hypothetical protein ADL21_06305 [Streptomyces albus subsp. albus]
MLLASLIVLGLVFMYAVRCWTRPFIPCPKCTANGVVRRGKKTKSCRHCRSTGYRLRRGRRAWNNWRRLHDQGTR